ncbi:ATP-dependent DNA ligase domain-containing protein [Cyclospora cayetanensis]|uniref:DNA ligase IV n=1 Tax=Cyclospora cayetanensis TaxID=88456 RepID=A0A1D3DB30_9EIME|nr:ATP-dependent DNA ligase domain-containing protein [Cyclospora cayetanensis]
MSVHLQRPTRQPPSWETDIKREGAETVCVCFFIANKGGSVGGKLRGGPVRGPFPPEVQHSNRMGEGGALPVGLVHNTEAAPFSEVCGIIQRLSDPHASSTEKTEYCISFLERLAPDCDPFPLLRLLLPHRDRRRPPLKLRLATLIGVYVEVFALPPAVGALLQSYRDPEAAATIRDGAYLGACSSTGSFAAAGSAKPGDFPSCLSAVLKQRIGNRVSSVTVEKTMHLGCLVRQLGPEENACLIGIITKNLKLGAAENRLLLPLDRDAKLLLARISDLKGVLDEIALRRLRKAPASLQKLAAQDTQVSGWSDANQEEELLFKPLRPMLASMCRQADLQGLLQLDSAQGQLIVEQKWDGERLLAHVYCGPGTEAKAVLFSRNGLDCSSRYGYTSRCCPQQQQHQGETGCLPDLCSVLLQSLLGHSCILDGEIFAYDAEHKRPLPLKAIRGVAAAETAHHFLVYMVFDILSYSSRDGTGVHRHSLLHMRLSDRKALLQTVLKPHPPRLQLAPFSVATNSQQILSRLKEVVHGGGEGLMLKAPFSFYALDSRQDGWFKLKPLFGQIGDSLDLIAIGAFYASTSTGRNLVSSSNGSTSEHATESRDPLSHCTHLLLGVIDPRDNRKVLSFCRVGGLSALQLLQLRGHLGPHAVRKSPGETLENTAPWLSSKCKSSTRHAVLLALIKKSCSTFLRDGAASPHDSTSSKGAPRETLVVRVATASRDEKEQQQLPPERRQHRDLIALPQRSAKAMHVNAGEAISHGSSPKNSPKSSGSTSTNEAFHLVSSVSLDQSATRRRYGAARRGGVSIWGSSYRLVSHMLPVRTTPAISLATGALPLSGVELWIIHGDRMHQKERLERIALSLGASLRQSPCASLFAAIAATASFRTSAVSKAFPEIPVLHLEWLLACQRQQQKVLLLPRFVLYAPMKVLNHLKEEYDKYGDGFFLDTTPDEEHEQGQQQPADNGSSDPVADGRGSPSGGSSGYSRTWRAVTAAAAAIEEISPITERTPLMQSAPITAESLTFVAEGQTRKCFSSSRVSPEIRLTAAETQLAASLEERNSLSRTKRCLLEAVADLHESASAALSLWGTEYFFDEGETPSPEAAADYSLAATVTVTPVSPSIWTDQAASTSEVSRLMLRQRAIKAMYTALGGSLASSRARATHVVSEVPYQVDAEPRKLKEGLPNLPNHGRKEKHRNGAAGSSTELVSWTRLSDQIHETMTALAAFGSHANTGADAHAVCNFSP